ncbi:MAG: acyl-CoA dehydrogenase family protein [Kiritimatiellae bacterium]|nr:acyl-CoA dehydrogenase family protein [Kiritimatiellia bacterium]
MANFYTDNRDLAFIVEQMVDWPAILAWKETLGEGDCPWADADEAKATFVEMLRDPVGEIAANRIAPRAEEVDDIGCRFENGQVVFPEALQRNLKDLRDAQLMGMTIPRRYGGLQFPETVYTAAIEIISQADASLMNFFGLQGGIAETIAQFASEELKARYLPRMSTGEFTGAMALTEPDAGSDLAAVQTRAKDAAGGGLAAQQDPATGLWTISGTKRFITNGCGDVILVLARSEDPEKKGGGRGLSFFLVEKNPRVRVRRIEHKLGIHGSPTCELQFDECPAYLIGARGMGLARYTAWLMLAARLAIGAQAQGIIQAALAEAEAYARQREQFGRPIRELPQVAAMLADLHMLAQASRAVLYAVSEIVDLHQGAEARGLREETRRYGRYAEALTPIAKYYTTEVANRIVYDALQIHGGNGFMQEYPIERLYRDVRITNIYEGTSQIQINWAIPRLVRGDLDDLTAALAAHTFADSDLGRLQDEVNRCFEAYRSVIGWLRDKDAAFREMVGPQVIDMFVEIYAAWLLLRQAERWEYKRPVAARFIRRLGPRVAMNRDLVLNARMETIEP